ILSRLNHPYIPKRYDKFNFITKTGEMYPCLILEYIQGQTLEQILEQRGKLTENEVKRIGLEILEILTYIHNQNIVHRDISPDNIILRNYDNKPVLIDFGGVKDFQPNAANQGLKNIHKKVLNKIGVNKTRLGKVGYSPEEQMRMGDVYPSSDFYALGVTMLVLLTGETPDAIYDNYKGNWRWQDKIKASADLERILRKMVAYFPEDRYQTTAELINDFQLQHLGGNQNTGSQIITSVTKMATVLAQKIVGATPISNYTNNPQIPRSQKLQNMQDFITSPQALTAGGIVILSLTGLLAWNVIAANIQHSNSGKKDQKPNNPKTEQPQPVAQTRQQKILQRQKDLGVSDTIFYRTIDKRFNSRHPELKGRNLDPSNPQDAQFISEWWDIAEQFLNEKEQGKK
ncbi:MAG TPA: serine/threonine-protein kinase, partial [Allocoleopsis sp.]